MTENEAFARLSPEHRYILELCRRVAVHGAAATSPALPYPCDWGRLLWTAQKHKVLPLVANCVLPSERHLVPYTAQSVLFDALQVARIRDDQRARAARELHAALDAAGVAALPRKGPVYQRMLYGSSGVRVYGDIDFYVGRDDLPSATTISTGLGYQFGYFDRFAGRSIGTERRDRLYYHLYPDHAPRLFRPADSVLAPAVHLGFALDMAWHGSPYSADCDRVLDIGLANATKDPSIGLPNPGRAFHFIDCSLHLFRETYFTRGMNNGNDVTLSKFLDHGRLWMTMTSEDRSELRNLLGGTSMRWPVAWAAYHSDTIFDTTIVDQLSLRDFAGHEYVHSCANPDGTIVRHECSMIDRLFAGSSLDRPRSQDSRQADRLVF